MEKALQPKALYRRCDPEAFSFKTTAELEDLEEIIGQERALHAVRFGTRMQHPGYNLYVLGPAGVGKHSAVRQFLERESASKSRAPDWCYVNNFDDAQKPLALRLPSGVGVGLRRDLENLVQELNASIPAAFESDEYRNRMTELEQEFVERQERALGELQREAEQHQMRVLHTPHGFAIAPLKDGEVMNNEAFQKLPKEDQKRIESVMAQLHERVKAHIEQFPHWYKERREREKEINRDITMNVVGLLISELKTKYQDLPDVLNYLEAVQRDLVDSAHEFATQGQEAKPNAMLTADTGRPALHRYGVNLLVDQQTSEGAPVIYEHNPTYQNLRGRVEHMSQLGTLVTNFTLIRPGALHRANGGYLILDVHKVLMNPYAWEGLKQALYAREIRLESLGQALSLISTVSLEPQPIPLDVKVVLLGDRLLYYLLYQFDPDFSELFKVAADFEERMDSDPENFKLYAQLIATLARKGGLRPFDRAAVARIIEHSSRMVGDAEKLSTHMRGITDLLHEAEYWAIDANKNVVAAAHVQQAIDHQIHRHDRIRSAIQEAIHRGTILIATEGEKVAQVNGLSVIDLGNFAFGQPSRITATARLGKGEVVDIEREAKLGGAIHSKGVLILSAFLGARYAKNNPLSLYASLVFEQTYGTVEGDSASVAELCALLSALGDIPLKQSLAVTGSVNQHGQVQAIGGVNEKIEGFFDVCKTRGLTGDQGVLIPASNVENLMLRDDVVEAAAQGKFRVYPLTTVDQALTLLTGVDAGERDDMGNFPEGSVNQRIEARLTELVEIQQALAESAKTEGDDE